jgi:hypothetical protein
MVDVLSRAVCALAYEGVTEATLRGSLSLGSSFSADQFIMNCESPLACCPVERYVIERHCSLLGMPLPPSDGRMICSPSPFSFDVPLSPLSFDGDFPIPFDEDFPIDWDEFFRSP